MFISRKINRLAILGNYLLRTKLVSLNNDKILSYQANKLKEYFPCFSTNASGAPLSETYEDKQDEGEKDNCEEYEIDYNNITEGDKELEHKLKILMLEVEVLRQQGYLIPENNFINAEYWKHLLNLPTRSARRKYLDFLFKVSKKKENKKLKKTERKNDIEIYRSEHPLQGQKVLSIEEHALRYDLKYNSQFLRIYDGTINRFYNKNLINAMQYGQKLVIDCGFDQDMTERENAYCAKQMMLLFADNRSHSDPFDIHYANYNREGMIAKKISRYIPTLYDNDFPINIHKESYLDVFPQEKLIYLTPHCKEQMGNFDHDAIYIIGGIVDKANNDPLSLAKAKREGIRMLKFPLDKFLIWGSGSGKSLTLNQCVAILLDIKATGDWQYALRHVPKRKLADLSQSIPGKNKRTFQLPSNKKYWKPH